MSKRRKPFPLPDGEPLCMAPYMRRATVRQLRLHAWGGLRLAGTAGAKPKWLKNLDAAERYADGELTAADLDKVRRSADRGAKPTNWLVDAGFAFQTDEWLRNIWTSNADDKRLIIPGERDYPFALPRYRVFEELLGPDPLPPFKPEWRTDTAVTLARQMYDAREFSAMPILADALQDAGCDSEPILTHCRVGSALLAGRHGSPKPSDLRHLRGCWVLDLVLNLS